MAYLYRETTNTVDLTSIIEEMIGEGVNRLTEEEMRMEVEGYSWKGKGKSMKKIGVVQQSQSQGPGERGLLNIGNCTVGVI